jgi:rhodanese-related sulfurtransferase
VGSRPSAGTPRCARQPAATQVGDLDRLARDYLGERDEVESISRDEVLSRTERGELVLVDVRPPAEFAAGHLPGAISIPPDQLELLDELPTDRDVVAYCRGPYCAYADDAVRHLLERGRRAMRLEEGSPSGGTPADRSNAEASTTREERTLRPAPEEPLAAQQGRVALAPTPVLLQCAFR